MIDLHCHVLAGIDDGPETLEASLALAAVAAERGTQTIVATPHVSWKYPNDARTIADRVDELNAELAAERIAVTVLAGAELAMTRATDLTEEDIAPLTLGGGEWLLIEPPFSPVATGLDALVIDLMYRGYKIVVAHPERCAAMHRDPALLGTLVRAGALTSVTAGSLDGRFGSQVRRFALRLFDEGMVHNVASDAHDEYQRAPGMSDEIAQAGLAELGAWLTELVPAAILGGEPIPPPPPVTRARQRQRGLFGRLRRG